MGCLRCWQLLWLPNYVGHARHELFHCWIISVSAYRTSVHIMPSLWAFFFDLEALTLTDFPTWLVVLAKAVVMNLLEGWMLVCEIYHFILGIGPVSCLIIDVTIILFRCWRKRDFMAYGTLFSNDMLELDLLLSVMRVFVCHCSSNIKIELYVVFPGRL